MCEAGLIDALSFSSGSELDWRPVSLTWAGHDFMDAARDEHRWDRAKRTIKEKAGAVGFEVLKAVLVSLARGQLGL